MKLQLILTALMAIVNSVLAASVPQRAVEPQPLAENARRIVEVLDYLGQPVSTEQRRAIDEARQARDAIMVQDALDPLVMFVVSINPEGRVKAARGEGPARLQQGGSVPVLIKIINEGDVTAPLGIDSPQAGSSYAGVSEFSLQRQQQITLNDKENTKGQTDRFLQLEMFSERPMTDRLSGLEVEYAIALIHSSEAGQRSATIQFEAGQGTEDLGFRAEVPVLFDVRPAVRVKLSIFDHDGTQTVGKLELTDGRGHVYPPQARRIAPDFFFQKQIYRKHGESVLLPPGRFTLKASRGPEYRILERQITIPEREDVELAIKLQRWIDTEAWGFYSGDHHIHAAGCAHY
ncbi:MAG TPA: hypothetical protein VLA12_03025, partial [Planctomycetaceae bacterium]|nr:hypothetical protein [Planctomycetaceae bacterium]